MLRAVLLGFMALALALPAAAQDTLALQATVRIERASIRLGDVFSALPAGKDQDIATAPAPGKSVVYDVRVLTNLAQQHGLKWQPRSTVDKCVITRAGTPLPMDKLSGALLSKIAEQASVPATDAEITLDNRMLAIVMPAEAPEDFTIENFSYDPQNQRFRGDIVAQTGSDSVRKPFTGRLILKNRVPVLVKRLGAGTVIGARDLDWISVRREQLGTDVVTDAAILIGQELRHDLAEGQVLRQRDIAPPRLVTRGMMVTMKIETPLMLITTQGRALQDGARGDTVRVTNTQSNRIVEGVIEADGIVRVPALQKVAALAGAAAIEKE